MNSDMWKVSPLVIVWVSILAMSLFSPDFISGSQQEHLPLIAMTAWISGVGASKAIMGELVNLKGKKVGTKWQNSVVLILIVWAVAAVVGINSPIFETGTDPTQIPVVGIVAPIVAAVLTEFLFKYSDLFFDDE